MGDLISRQAAIEALLEKGQCSKRYRLGDIWELNFDEIREAIATVPSAQPTQTDTSNTLKALDCVERRAAIDALEKWESESTWDEWCYDHKDEAEKHSVISPSSVVSGLQSALPDTQWIPCSPETMPKKTGYYLVQYTRKYCRNEMAVAFYSVEEARCDDDYTWEIETFSDIKEVIAWMPLPKPYCDLISRGEKMNRQRKVVITVTYNDLGTIVDTKAEELDLSAQPERKTGKWEQESESLWKDRRS